MPAFHIVPQLVVDRLGPALSANHNLGAVIAEQLCRTENGGTLIQKLMAGQELDEFETAQLPPLRSGHTWQEVADYFAEKNSDPIEEGN